MARYRRIDVRMWGDRKFRSLSPLQPSGQALWIYLLTGPHTTNVPGLYHVGPMTLAERLGWPLKALREAFQEAFQQGLAEASFDAPLVWIPNAIHYNKPASPNVVLSWRDNWSELPECGLKLKAYNHLEASMKAFGKAYLKAFGKACVKPLPNQEQEQEQEQDKISSTSVDGVSVEDGVEIYHSLCPSLPRVSRVTQQRRAKWRARSREPGWEELFGQACAGLEASSFAREGKWASFDWLISNDTNAVKAAEGKYQDREDRRKHDPLGLL